MELTKEPAPRLIYSFGAFQLDPTERRLVCDGREVRLPPKVFELLVILVERHGLLVEKDDLMKALWPDMFVEEITLTGNISRLRKALGDAPGQDESLYIETVSKRGYRFIAEVTEISQPPGPLPVDQVLKFGAQIADALDKAHNAGIIHRDLTLSDSSSTSIPVLGQRVSGKRGIWIAASVAAALICGLIVWWRQPPAVPMVEAVTQLTDDGEIKVNSGNLVTDGSRIYFGEGTFGGYRIMQVAATGGPTAIIPTRFPNFHFTALSQDGSYLLGAAGNSLVLPWWAVPLPAGEPRRLGSIEAQDADLFPDGRILFCLGKDLYIAEKDGSQPRKLLSANGVIRFPSVSADGERLVFTVLSHGRRTIFNRPISIDEARADGSGHHPILNTSDAGQVCCARWTPDGRYIVYLNRYEGRFDLWAFPMRAGLLQRSQHPIRLTNGPLTYRSAVVSRDGKQIFAVGMRRRGELVRYDVNSKQFLPLLPGVAAFDPTFSRDGEWVAYTAYPDYTLWRSRSDGTEPLQLTFPPKSVFFPSISPDGKQVAYTTVGADGIHLISMDGGSPQIIAEGDSCYGPNWSPDGKLLVFADINGIHLFDLGTGKRSVVPGSEDMDFPRWVAEDMLAAATPDHKKLMVFDIKTQRWSDLVSSTTTGYIVSWIHSPDYKYVYYTTGGAEPMALRVRLADRAIETITSLKGLRRGIGPGGNTEISVAPDGSAVFTRNTGTEEIYALTVKWP